MGWLVVKGQGHSDLVFGKTLRKRGSSLDVVLAEMTLTRLRLTCRQKSHSAVISLMKSEDSGKGSHLWSARTEDQRTICRTYSEAGQMLSDSGVLRLFNGVGSLPGSTGRPLRAAPSHTHTHTPCTIHLYNSGYAMVVEGPPQIVQRGGDECRLGDRGV